MIVMKFGGTSVADAERILAVAEIVRERVPDGPLVVLSALSGVTDLLLQAFGLALANEREDLERTLGELERRHRWALTGTVEEPGARHDLSLSVDALFEELRQLLRSVRFLGEGTPRARDAILAFGEILSTRIAVAAFAGRGIPARWVDPREVVITDDRYGAAEPDLRAVEQRARASLGPLLAEGSVPVVGGFVGSTHDGVGTTLGRGGSDTSAAVLGLVLAAEEIQIWSDVDGLMSADPTWVPAARSLERLSFAEAAELAYYGARVLHPASIAPAVKREVPVRVLNSLRPEGRGTVILGEPDPEAPSLASISSRGGVSVVRVTDKTMRRDRSFLARVLGAFEAAGAVPEIAVSSGVSVAVVVPQGSDLAAIARSLDDWATLEVRDDRSVVCVVGSGLATDAPARGEVLSALAALEPDLVAEGGSATSVSAVIPQKRLPEAVRELHRRFFERRGPE